MQQEQNYENAFIAAAYWQRFRFIQHTCGRSRSLSKKSRSHFKLVKVGTINVSQVAGPFLPSDLRGEKLSGVLADGDGKILPYYRCT